MRRLLSLVLLLGSPAYAQRTSNNAVTSADDAFGRAVGNEKIGIYTTEEVRGFNPIEAGNVRIEGLSFDQLSNPSQRLVDSSSVRVGWAARGYPFPAPTGIADLRLEKFEGQRVISFDTEHEDDSNHAGSIQLKLPLAGDKFGLAAGYGMREAKVPQGRNGQFKSMALALTWRPMPDAELTAFASGFFFRKGRVQPVIFPAGISPPKMDRRINYGQPWARNRGTGQTHGVVAKLPLGDFRLEAGLFYSAKDDPRSFAELLIGTNSNGVVANRILIADADNSAHSYSGEVRLSRVWQSGSARHMLTLMAKGRDQQRDYGGQQSIAFGRSTSIATDFRPQPAFAFGTNDQSNVKQRTIGAGYDLIISNLGSLNLGIQKSDYEKVTRFANRALPELVSRDKPWLFNVNGSVRLAKFVSAYGGYVRGLEESPVAPDAATNRNEAPPAIRTRQADFGFRFALTPHLSLIAGVFEVTKPYFNIDAARRFRELGSVSNRGVELSVAGTLAKGLTVIGGTLLLDPKISGTEVTSGRIGPRPIGSFKRRSVANIDWRPGGKSNWSFDLAFDSTSHETGNAANSFAAAPRETVNLGTRYRFKLGSAKLLLRGQVTNIFNDFGWKVSSSGGFTHTLPRTFVVNLAADL